VIRVRFLGELDGIMTHYSGGTIPCFGEKCRYCKQFMPKDYRGYVAAESRDTVRGLWLPTVVEVTERMFWCLDATVLRGTVWDLYRESHGKRKTTCLASLIGEIDPKTLPHRFDVLPVVKRLYRNLPLSWGQKPELGAPLTLPCSVDPDASPAVQEDAPKLDPLQIEYPREEGENLLAYVLRLADIRKHREGKLS
jgi:hypothetical protein